MREPFVVSNSFLHIMQILFLLLPQCNIFRFLSDMAKQDRRPRRTLEWRVRETMAIRGIGTVTALVDLLKKHGYEISISQLGRMIDGKSKNFNSETVVWLMEVMKCDLDGIIVSRRR